ncbi:MAG: hypothetical protein RIB84_00650 [Sneathiellaceae bacterium]
MTQSARNTLLLAKIESSEGVDPTPTAAANAMLVSNLQVSPFEAQVATRATTQPFQGGRQRIHHGIFSRCSFEVEMIGSGANNVAPAYGPLMRACGFSQTARSGATGTIGDKVAVGTPDGTFTFTKTTAFDGTAQRTVTLECTTGGGSGTAEFTVSAPAAGGQAAYNETGEVMTDSTPFDLGGSAQITPTVGTDFSIGDTWEIEVLPVRTEYALVSAAHSSVTLYYYYNASLHAVTGFRGEFGMKVENGLPMLTFSGFGQKVDPTSTALPSDEDFAAFRRPLPASPTNTPMVQLHRHDLRLMSWSLQLGNQADPRRLVNHYSVPIRDRDVTGQINFEAPLQSAFNPWAIAEANTLGRWKVQQGAATGDIVGVWSERCQILQPQYSEQDSIVHLQANLAFVPDAGNDELIVYTA